MQIAGTAELEGRNTIADLGKATNARLRQKTAEDTQARGSITSKIASLTRGHREEAEAAGEGKGPCRVSLLSALSQVTLQQLSKRESVV